MRFFTLHYKFMYVHVGQKVNQFVSIMWKTWLSNAHITFFDWYLERGKYLVMCVLVDISHVQVSHSMEHPICSSINFDWIITLLRDEPWSELELLCKYPYPIKITPAHRVIDYVWRYTNERYFQLFAFRTVQTWGTWVIVHFCMSFAQGGTKGGCLNTRTYT